MAAECRQVAIADEGSCERDGERSCRIEDVGEDRYLNHNSKNEFVDIIQPLFLRIHTASS